jgi:hypothetical protein
MPAVVMVSSLVIQLEIFLMAMVLISQMGTISNVDFMMISNVIGMIYLFRSNDW